MRRRKDTDVLHLGVGGRESTSTECWCQHLDLWSSNILPSCCQILMSLVWPMSSAAPEPSHPPGPCQGLWLLCLCWLSYSTQNSGGTRSSSFSYSNLSVSSPCHGPDHHTARALCGTDWSGSEQRYTTSNQGIAVRLSEEQTDAWLSAHHWPVPMLLSDSDYRLCWGFCFVLFFKVLKVHTIWVPSVIFLPSVKPFLTTADQESVFPSQLQPTGIFMVTFCFRDVCSMEKCDSTAALLELCP